MRTLLVGNWSDEMIRLVINSGHVKLYTTDFYSALDLSVKNLDPRQLKFITEHFFVTILSKYVTVCRPEYDEILKKCYSENYGKFMIHSKFSLGCKDRMARKLFTLNLKF